MTEKDCIGCTHYHNYSKRKGSNEWECEWGMSIAYECINDGYSKKHKTCPFCGGSPKLESDSHRKEFGRDRFRIVCSSCYAGTRWYNCPDEAWLMWNGRVRE